MEQESFKEFISDHQKLQNQSQKHNETLKQQEPNQKNYKLRGPPKGSKRRPNLAVGIKSGLWTLNQMKGYLKFITRFENHFKDKATRKKKKIFHRMANLIKSRTAQQCRSHHQKLELKFIQHEKIINFINKEIALKLLSIQQKPQDDFDGQQLQVEDRPLMKQENVQMLMSEKTKQKKTELNDHGLYEITEVRQGWSITIYEENMQIW